MIKVIIVDDEIDISRGDVLAQSNDRPEVTDQFMAHLLWMSNEPMLPSRPYILKANNKTVSATITDLKQTVSNARSLTATFDAVGGDVDKLTADPQFMAAVRSVTIGLGQFFHELYPASTPYVTKP